VLKLAADIGLEAIDAGSLVIARLLEYGMLWIHLALVRGMGRDYAFVLHRREKEAS
jgi:8-hydroxy-5-deazaflavin:NADPH oxidoreductase